MVKLKKKVDVIKQFHKTNDKVHEFLKKASYEEVIGRTVNLSAKIKKDDYDAMFELTVMSLYYIEE